MNVSYDKVKDFHIGNKVKVIRPDGVMFGRITSVTRRVDEQYAQFRVLIELPVEKKGVLFVKTGDDAEISLNTEDK